MVKNFIFLGAPGVGKGTLAKKIAFQKGLVHISTGDIFRENIKNKTKMGLKIKSILESGNYVSDKLTNKIIEKRLSMQDVGKNGFILDGYPRTTNQAEFLKSLSKNKSIVVVQLVADDKTITSRLLKRAKMEHREDDTPKVINERIKIYREKTAPLISWYGKEKLLVNLCVQGSIEENIKKFQKEIY